jgi:hypothetical protein
VMVDGHYESWRHLDLRMNKNDVFGYTDLFFQ